jgi:ABC-type nitrate/sulfonate/bicarbonate transport system permease component
MNTYLLRHPILAGTVGIFIAIWGVIALLVNNPQEVAGPWPTALAIVKLFQDPVLRPLFFTSIRVTMTSIFTGFALAVVVGIPVGLLMGRFVVADLLLDPWVNAWYSIPAVAFVPLTMNWTGLTSTSAMIVAFLIAVFSIIINVYTGVKNVSGSMVETARAYGATGSQLMSKVILPASLPNIMVGLRLGISRAIDGVIIAEMIFSVVGLGGLIFDSADKLQMPIANGLIICLAIISIILNEAMKFANRKAVAWKEAAAMIRE